MKYLFFVAIGLAALVASCDELDPGEPGLLVPKTVDQDPSIPSISVNSTLLHSESFGDPSNPMIVALHGGPGGDYRHLLRCKEFVPKGYYLVFYDQRGSGLSKRESKTSYSMQLMLDDLAAVIAHYRTSPAQKVILLGHSWGAMLAAAYINQHPDAIDGAILCEPGGLVWNDVEDYLDRTMQLNLLHESLSDATFVDQLFTGKKTDHALLDYKGYLIVSTGIGPASPTGDHEHNPFWRYGAVVNIALMEIGQRDKPDWTTNLHSFNKKILFVYSEGNKSYGPAHAQLVSSSFPNADVQRVDGAGHEMLSFTVGWNNFFPLAQNYLTEIQ